MSNHIINDAICKLSELQGNKEVGSYFRNIPPVLWFGDLCSDKPKVLVISANPNRPDLPKDHPRISYCDKWKIGGRDIQELEKNFNEYFMNPATNWFGKNPREEKEDSQQGRIEDFLNGLDASFYDEAQYQAIHIDLLPFSTKKIFSKIATDIMAIDGLTAWINKHLQQMIDIVQPQLIVVNGSTNFDYFNLCINLDAQPYQAYKFHKSTIWKSAHKTNKPYIIGVSMNMGSYCRLKRQQLFELGQEVKKLTSL